MPKTPFNIQDQYLNQSRKERIRVIVQLMAGEKMDGFIKSFDNFSVLMEVRAISSFTNMRSAALLRWMARSSCISNQTYHLI